MANGKKIKGKNKVWRILKGKYKPKLTMQARAERLICAIQQELEWDEIDSKTHEMIQQGKIDWSGNARSKRRTRKNI